LLLRAHCRDEAFGTAGGTSAVIAGCGMANGWGGSIQGHDRATADGEGLD